MQLRTAVFFIPFFSVCLFAADAGSQPAAPANATTIAQVRRRHIQDEPLNPELEREMARARAKQRYADLKRDSEKLLEIATELKRYVDKSGESVLSLEVIRKAEEMEKLAKDVRKRMRGE